MAGVNEGDRVAARQVWAGEVVSFLTSLGPAGSSRMSWTGVRTTARATSGTSTRTPRTRDTTRDTYKNGEVVSKGSWKPGKDDAGTVAVQCAPWGVSASAHRSEEDQPSAGSGYEALGVGYERRDVTGQPLTVGDEEAATALIMAAPASRAPMTQPGSVPRGSVVEPKSQD